MSIHESLAVPYHQQDTDVYCGAACAQMVLDSIGAGIVDQDDIYTDERNHTNELSAWYNPPDGLQWVLNNRRPSGFGGWFALYALDTEDALSRKLVWTLHHYQVAPIAMVYKGDHWLVVRGYEASAAPTSSVDVSYTITAFEVNNPWPPVPSFYGTAAAPPPPHSGSDQCGVGGTRGVANEHIAYAAWQSFYATGNKYGALWHGKNVAVCDPDPPPDRPGKVAPPGERLRGDKLMRPSKAVECAVAGIRLYGLDKKRNWRETFKGTKPGRPMLVHRLDQLDSYYYIVPMERHEDIAAAVLVDARFGNYCESIAVPPRGQSLLTAMAPKTVEGLVAGKQFRLDETREALRVRNEAFCIYPTLVWQPCLESLSPFLPFHMITVGDRKLYIRVDGQIFTTLHINMAGI